MQFEGAEAEPAVLPPPKKGVSKKEPGTWQQGMLVLIENDKKKKEKMKHVKSLWQQGTLVLMQFVGTEEFIPFCQNVRLKQLQVQF